MTLDEAIKHEEEIAEKHMKKASWFFIKEGNPNYENCIEYAERHRKIVEWLKELKQLKEKESKNELKDLSKRVENIEKQMKEDKEEQLKKLKLELD